MSEKEKECVCDGCRHGFKVGDVYTVNQPSGGPWTVIIVDVDHNPRCERNVVTYHSDIGIQRWYPIGLRNYFNVYFVYRPS